MKINIIVSCGDIGPSLGFRAGFDMVYYHTIFDDQRFEETFQYYGSSYDRVHLGLSIGSELALGRFGLVGQVGYYLADCFLLFDVPLKIIFI